jgi:hypothetical protein
VIKLDIVAAFCGYASSDRWVRPPVDSYQSAPLRVSDPAGRSLFKAAGSRRYLALTGPGTLLADQAAGSFDFTTNPSAATQKLC